MREADAGGEDLSTALLEGPFEDPLWSSFLELLRSRTQASYASLIFRPVNKPLNALVELFAGERSPPRLQKLYTDEIYLRDPLPHYALADGRVYPLSELLNFERPDHAAFFRELLEPSGMSAMRIMRVVEATGVSAWLTIARPGPDFEAIHDSLLCDLAPHLRIALRTFVALERERFRADVAGQAFRRLDYGWLTLDAAGRVVDLECQAQQLLKRCSALRLTADRRLHAAAPGVHRDLTAALKAFNDDPSSRPRAIHLGRDPWMDMLLAPIQERAITASAPPVLIAYIHGDGWSTTDRCEQIAQLFGLSASESRLTLAISRGSSIAEAASDLGLTLETARNYSKRIYAKTGARGQPDLIRFVLASVLALA